MRTINISTSQSKEDKRRDDDAREGRNAGPRLEDDEEDDGGVGGGDVKGEDDVSVWEAEVGAHYEDVEKEDDEGQRVRYEVDPAVGTGAY